MSEITTIEGTIEECFLVARKFFLTDRFIFKPLICRFENCSLITPIIRAIYEHRRISVSGIRESNIAADKMLVESIELLPLKSEIPKYEDIPAIDIDYVERVDIHES